LISGKFRVMSKKVKVKEKSIKRPVSPKEKVVAPRTDDDREENDGATDFGGIPNRDLKKNLGCG